MEYSGRFPWSKQRRVGVAPRKHRGVTVAPQISLRLHHVLAQPCYLAID